MRIEDSIHFAFRRFRANPLRTILTISGVVVGIGSILFFLSLGYGLRLITLHEISTSDALRVMTVTPGSSKTLHLDTQTIQRLVDTPKIESYSPTLQFSSRVTFQKTTTESLLYGLDPVFQEAEIGIVESGLPLSVEDRGLLISTTLMNLLGVEDAKSILDQDLQLQLFPPAGKGGSTTVERTQRVRGVFSSKSAIAVAPIQSLYDLPILEFSSLKIRVKDRSEFDNVRAEIEVQGFSVEALADTITEVNMVFEIIQVVLAFFGLIALFVAAIGMFNTMTIALLERTREIGILKSLGATNRDILVLFLIESLTISTVGGLAGMGSAIALGSLANFGIRVLARSFGGESVTVIVVPWFFVFLMMGVSLILGLICGLYPAFRASKLDPMTALRYE